MPHPDHPLKPARLTDVRNALNAEADPEKARLLGRFFKTRKGEYGEKDQFIGVIVPVQRQIAKRFRLLRTDDAVKLLHSRIHEHRLTALLILVDRYQRGSSEERARVYHAYLKNTPWINNWDLVDLSAPIIVGDYLVDKSRNILKHLARSANLWERRIAIISTFTFIRRHEYADTFEIAGILIHDDHDLIHKAVGWMLREIGKRDKTALDAFLRAHAPDMPRTMLRYAIERHQPSERTSYLSLPSKRRRKT